MYWYDRMNLTEVNKRNSLKLKNLLEGDKESE